jgi:hypothetical protein
LAQKLRGLEFHEMAAPNLSALAWLWYFAADATCVGGYLISLRLEPSAWRWLSSWWLGSLALPALIVPQQPQRQRGGPHQQQQQRLPGPVLSCVVLACVVVPPTRLSSPALRFVYGMAGAFRAMRLRTLLLQHERAGAVLSAATLWGCVAKIALSVLQPVRSAELCSL